MLFEWNISGASWRQERVVMPMANTSAKSDAFQGLHCLKTLSLHKSLAPL